MQHCEDALTDPRVNVEACGVLRIRSIVVLPVAEGAKLWGILEIFSCRPHAFSDTDIQALQALGRKVSHTVQEAVEGESVTPEPDAWPGEKADPEYSETMAREAVAREVLESSLRDPSARRRDYRTTALTATVIALAVLLGWMVGRAGWSMAVNRGEAPLPASPEEVQASVQVTPQTAPRAKAVEEVAPSAKPASAPLPASPALRPDPKSTAPAAEPAGGLVVYEQGKVVFRMAPRAAASGRDSGSVQTSPAEGGPAAGVPGPVSPPTSYLLERVEPQYPEAARQQHLQGPVVLSVLVGTDGAVRELKVVSGDPLLAKAATDAVRQWRFRPHRSNDGSVEFETRITVNFALP
jgi:protein TonB